MDNMLMSLNPDQVKAFSQPRGRLDLSAGSDAPNSSRHLHSSSTHSDFTLPSDDAQDRRSFHLGRSRRSNSSSNFPTNLRRVDPAQAKSENVEDSRAARAGGTVGLPKGHRRGADSQGSLGSSNGDYGHVGGQLKKADEQGRRSASLDQSLNHRTHSASQSGTYPPMPSSLSQPVLYDDLEAAPTPTVPAGPRRDQSPRPTQKASVAPSMQRRNSNKSTKSHSGKKNKIDSLPWEPTVTNGKSMSRRASKQITTGTGFLRSRNTSPNRQFSEPVLGFKRDANALSKDQKPGFFRRVFGSSKASIATTQPSIPFSSRDQSGDEVSAQSRLHKTPAIDDLTNPPELTHPPLHKKPSSFFRRRKKSVSDSTHPPLLPFHVQSNASTTPVEPARHSPVSSLRKVMNPYLDGSGEGDNHRPSHAKRLQAQISSESTLPPTSYDGADIRPSQPRALPSQEEIAAVAGLINADGRSIDESAGINTLTLPPVNKSQDSSHPSNTERAGGKFPVRVPPRQTGPMKSPEKKKQSRKDEDNSIFLPPVRSDEGQPAFNRPYDPPIRRPLSPTNTSHLPSQVPDEQTNQIPSGENVDVSPASDYHSATSIIHPLKTDQIQFPDSTVHLDSMKPSEENYAQAKQLFDGNESLVSRETAAAWLGEPDPERACVRHAYMELFEWQDLTILAALRDLCGKLYLKGEAQQVDRILDAFANRWFTCNPNNGFKANGDFSLPILTLTNANVSLDVVHTICYSILMLNTDLHQAEIETKMTRNQFLKNIMPTVRRVVTDAAPDAFTNNRSSTMPPPRQWAETASSTVAGKPPAAANGEGRRSFEGQRPSYKLSSRPSDQTTYTSSQQHTPVDFSSSAGGLGPMVKSGFHGKLSAWENQIEVILKDFYTSIRQQPLPLHGTDNREQAMPETPMTTHSVSGVPPSLLRRTPSMLSKAGSEHLSYRGRPTGAEAGRLGSTVGRWQSKTRSRPRLYPASTVASSRRSSFDEQSSVTSPSVTSAWSRFSSFGRTQTSLSVESFGTRFPPVEFQQSIGFANALSQAIIREEHNPAAEVDSLHTPAPAALLEDESLELAGAPWAKEGILKHKHHLESVDKRAKDRNWIESFAVIEKGQMRLFSFSTSAKSLRAKAKMSKTVGGPVGGGNWADNAEVLGSFALRQTIASALPPPGYSKARPHVWALSLPTGAVHLFQVGTPEIVKEFVTTANYWSARLSKEPLTGAVSNIEYGWSDSVINTALLSQNHSENTPLPPSVPTQSITVGTGPTVAARPSLQSSIRSARSSSDQASTFGVGTSSLRPKLPGDKIHLQDWQPPPQSLATSALLEVDQLKALHSYVQSIENELAKHNELRGPMLLAFSPRGTNYARAMTNWERKSAYLLREIVKFRTYMDCLQAAQVMKEGVLREKRGREDERARDLAEGLPQVKQGADAQRGVEMDGRAIAVGSSRSDEEQI